MYDLIGDIHGHATELRSLLTRMGYGPVDGVWQHPERKAIFLGDFVDRGPEQVEVVTLARDMVVQGHALAVMGNHEFNAVAWTMPDPERPGEFLRPHSSKNRNQHQAFLEQVGEGSELHQDFVGWFRALPLYLDLPEFRVVHACWHEEYLNVISHYTDDQNCLLPEAWVQCARKGSEAYEAVETLLKGIEVPLPNDLFFLDKDQNPRTNARIKWWEREKLTYRDLAMVPGAEIGKIPHTPVPEHVLVSYDCEKPVFVGHYWLKGTPAPLSDHVACLDYSVAKKGGRLCAYRFSGGNRLKSEDFVWVESV